jgi:hypothetical protein
LAQVQFITNALLKHPADVADVFLFRHSVIYAYDGFETLLLRFVQCLYECIVARIGPIWVMLTRQSAPCSQYVALGAIFFEAQQLEWHWMHGNTHWAVGRNTISF